MTRPALLAPGEILPALEDLEGWTMSSDGRSIHREFTFASFAVAFGFMTECALIAEKMDHHPEWANVYRKVRVVLTTHSAGGITALDIQLARAMNKAASGRTSA